MRKIGFDLDQYVFPADAWETPATHYPELATSTFRIHHSYYPRGYYSMWGVKDYLYFKSAKRIPLTMLQEKRGSRWHTWMVDDPPHWYAMDIYAQAAKGRVLVAGLGLGLICHCLANNPEVMSIDVIEKSQDVIELAGSLIPRDERMEVYHTDLNSWIEENNGYPYDTIIVDLWTTSSGQKKMDMYYKEVLPLFVKLCQFYPTARKVFH